MPSKRDFKIDICGYEYQVQYIKDLRDENDSILCGDSDTHKFLIRVREGMVPEQQTSTLLHEILHCIDHHLVVGIDEDAVRRIESGLHGVLKTCARLLEEYN